MWERRTPLSQLYQLYRVNYNFNCIYAEKFRKNRNRPLPCENKNGMTTKPSGGVHFYKIKALTTSIQGIPCGLELIATSR